MNLTIKINYDLLKEISWPIVFLCIVKSYIERYVFFLLELVIILILIGFSKKIIIPKIKGWNIYIISIMVMTIYGFAINDTEDVVIGAFHILPTIITVILGYLLCRVLKNNSIEKTIVVILNFYCIKDWVNVFMDPSIISRAAEWREVFRNSIYEVTFAFVIVFFEIVICRKRIISKSIDYMTILLSTITILISMGRTEIVCAIVGVLILYLLSFLKKFNISHALKTAVLVTTAGVSLIILSYNFLPQDLINPFVEKLENTSVEISANNEYKTEEQIGNNWRGYEINCATRQWKESNLLEAIVGHGIGSKVMLYNLSRFYVERYQLLDRKSPILHNGFYTLLIRGGLLAVIGLLTWYLYPLFLTIREKYNIQKKKTLIVMVALNGMMLLCTYVVRGVCTQSVFMIWSLCIGWYNCKLQKLSIGGQTNE